MQMAFMLKEIHMTIFFHLGVIGTIGFGHRYHQQSACPV